MQHVVARALNNLAAELRWPRLTVALQALPVRDAEAQQQELVGELAEQAALGIDAAVADERAQPGGQAAELHEGLAAQRQLVAFLEPVVQLQRRRRPWEGGRPWPLLCRRQRTELLRRVLLLRFRQLLLLFFSGGGRHRLPTFKRWWRR